MKTMEDTRSAWDRIAAGYDRYVTPARGTLPEEALRRAGLREGMRFLDLASGSGALALPATHMGARVTAVDFSPAMIERLLVRARDEGLSEIEARVMDGHALDLGDDTFDVTGSHFGVMLFPDLPQGLREMVRVTRPGGRVFLVAYGPPSSLDFLDPFFDAMKRVDPEFEGLPADPPPLPFQVADPEVLHTRMVEAGLDDVHVEPASERLEFSSGSQVWDWVTNSNPIATRIIGNLTADECLEVQNILDGRIRERADGEGTAVIDNAVHIATGTK